jgi:hypothetical protein
LKLIRDPAELESLVKANAPAFIIGKQSPAEWLSAPANFALRENNDLGMFEAHGEWPGPLSVHAIFESRGKQALETARKMLEHAFGYGATSIHAEPETPAATMFARLLGFKLEDDKFVLKSTHPEGTRLVA